MRRARACANVAAGAIALTAFSMGVPVRAQQPSRDAPSLDRVISLQLHSVSMAEALSILRHRYGIALAFSGDLIPPRARVNAALASVTVRTALETVLAGSDLTFVVIEGGTVVIVPRVIPAGNPSEPSRRDVDRGLRATGAARLDEIVVMGTAVNRLPAREQPTAVSVVPAERLAGIPTNNFATLIRQLVPGVAVWDRGPLGAPATVAAVRGTSSFTTQSLKTYVDGIELASPELFTLLDPRAIERIEVVRGPQGAALYGPDALNGILQLESRKGRVGPQSPEVRADASAGVNSRADAAGSEFVRDAGAGATGGGNLSSFDMSGRVVQVGNDPAARWRQSWNVQGGGRILAGDVAITASARAGRYEYSAERAFEARAVTSDTVPLAIAERAFGVKLEHAIGERWRHSVVVGHDWISGDREPARSALIAPRLPLGASHETASRTSARYSAAYDLTFHAAQLLLSGGVELTRREIARAERVAADREASPLYDDDLRSTGVFAQVRARLDGHLTLSAGVRDESVSSVGAAFGPVWAATGGAAWSVPLGTSTLHFRGAWGKGIRPPEPGITRTMASGTIQQEANDALAPESQRGFEAGAELYAPNGSSIAVTWYHQQATDLIQQVDLRRTNEFRRIYQFQNVGAIGNRGIEVEGRLRRGAFSAAAFAAVGSSKVLRLSPTYGGELQVGDRLLGVPASTGAISGRYDGRRVRLETGITWLGSWVGYDWILIARVDRGETPPRGAPRDYWRRYPAALRPYVSASIDLGRHLSGFVRVDNPGNAVIVVRDNLGPPAGRFVQLGITTRP